MVQDITRSIEACAVHYGDEADAMHAYLTDGQRRALEIDNRGPIKFDLDGRLDPAILAAYSKYGFYIFENVMDDTELAGIRQDLQRMRDNFPVLPEAGLDAKGAPALGADCKAPTLQWLKPLSDPLGGIDLLNDRHQVKLFEPTPADDAPAFSPYVLSGHLQFSEASLRAYGHPQLLKVAEAIHGDDFAPFNEVIFLRILVLAPLFHGIRTVTHIGIVLILMRIFTDSTSWPKFMEAPRLMVFGSCPVRIE